MARFCSKCGKEIMEDAEFCVKCGERLSPEDSIKSGGLLVAQEKKSGKGCLVFLVSFVFSTAIISMIGNSIKIDTVSKSDVFFGSAVLGGILALIIAFVYGVRASTQNFKRQDEERQVELKEKGAVDMLQTKHQAGLPLAEGVECKLVYCLDHISVEGGGNIFNLPLERVRDITLTTDVDIQKSYVSSIGGAAGGAYLFGPIGAMIGGRAKEKTSKIETHYLIVSYEKEGDLDYIAFNLGQANILGKRIVDLFKQQEKQTVHIDL